MNKFILSDERKYRIMRHLLFWAIWGSYFTMIRYLNPSAIKNAGHFEVFLKCVVEASLMLLPQLFLAYPLLYFILPRYVFNGKYIKAFAWFIVFLFLCFTINAFLLIYIPQYLPTYLPRQLKLFEGKSFIDQLQLAYLASLQGAVTGAALAGSFKMFRYYYLKDLRNQQLQRENTESQLQLLKAQVHPHFLFNTLNNIYSQTQVESPKGSKMIMGLSDILRYILYEGQKPLVPLKQELLMITEYINLEKLRYGNKLDVHVLTPDSADELYIAPLILIPFVENCFKHGTSNMLQNPWINLIVELKDNLLVMKLMNGKAPLNGNIRKNPGIGINNVRQRLDLLYKDKHDLQIREEDEVFVVDLKIELVRIKNQDLANPTQSQPNIAYA